MTAIDTARRDQLAERLFNAGLATMDVLSVYLGERLGLYRALRERGPLDATALARAAGVHERYAREWLEQQAVTGIVDAHLEGAQRRFSLSPEHAEVLLDASSTNYLAPFARMLAGTAKVLDSIAEAYRSGSGVPWAAYGQDMISGQADFNRPAFRTLLTSEWLPQIRPLHERLTQGARVTDVGCGAGWSAVALAQGYPGVSVDGYDYDPTSIDLARAHAKDAGVDDRVRFHLADASDGLHGAYDLVTVFEALHDMSRPVDALAGMRRLLAPGGAVLVMDERVHPEFGPGIGDDIERMMYGWSVLVCLVNAMAESPTAATGTVMRESTLRAYASEAGFATVEAPLETEFFRFYVLRP
jgi:2-polyprenyl-3-methyl-5-hydroxy-6-metoxy-1,4-benzoquinol methylase